MVWPDGYLTTLSQDQEHPDNRVSIYLSVHFFEAPSPKNRLKRQILNTTRHQKSYKRYFYSGYYTSLSSINCLFNKVVVHMVSMS